MLSARLCSRRAIVAVAPRRLHATPPRRNGGGVVAGVHTCEAAGEFDANPTSALVAAVASFFSTSKTDPLRRITVLGAGANVALALGKGVAGVLGNSAAMIADAAHSLSDLLSDFVTLYVLKEAHKPADADHPYGHGKYESIGSLSLAAVLVGTGAAIGLHSIHLLQELSVATAEAAAAAAPTSLAAVAAVVSVLVKEALYHATVRVGTQHNSSVVVANAWHHRADGLTSLVALAGIGGSMLGFPVADPLAGLVVAGAITKFGVESGVGALRDLTDRQVDGESRSQLEEVLAREKGVRSFHKLRLRATGPTVVADVHIVVDPLLSVSAAHQIAERVRVHAMRAMHPHLADLLVHIDVAEDGEIEDRLDASDLARAVCDIEGDIRAIAARFCASSSSTSSSSPFAEVRSVACHLDGRRCTAAVRVALVAGAQVDVPAVARAAAALKQQLKAGVFDLDDVTVDIDLCALDAGDARQRTASSSSSVATAAWAPSVSSTVAADSECASPIAIATPAAVSAARRVVAAEHRSSLVEPLSPDALARLRPVVVWKVPARFSDAAVAATM